MVAFQLWSAEAFEDARFLNLERSHDVANAKRIGRPCRQHGIGGVAVSWLLQTLSGPRYPLDQAGVLSQASGEHVFYVLFMDDMYRVLAESHLSARRLSEEGLQVNCKQRACRTLCTSVPIPG